MSNDIDLLDDPEFIRLVPSMLADINETAEYLYNMHGVTVPDGVQFSRGLDSLAERCFVAACAAYYFSVAEDDDPAPNVTMKHFQ